MGGGRGRLRANTDRHTGAWQLLTLLVNARGNTFTLKNAGFQRFLCAPETPRPPPRVPTLRVALCRVLVNMMNDARQGDWGIASRQLSDKGEQRPMNAQ